ncbi:MAG: DUF192 domain-containing protein [Flavobacteriaceae bacterium]
MSRSQLLIFLILSISISVWSCKEPPPKQTIETPEISFTQEGELTIYRAGTNTVLAQLDIEIAESEYETATGLMYRKGMLDKQAMLFVFDYVGMHSFYMKNTEFALDILFIDDQLHLASFEDNALALDESGISSQVPIQYVLEVNAGLREKWGLAVGDSIAFTRQ